MIFASCLRGSWSKCTSQNESKHTFDEHTHGSPLLLMVVPSAATSQVWGGGGANGTNMICVENYSLRVEWQLQHSDLITYYWWRNRLENPVQVRGEVGRRRVYVCQTFFFWLGLGRGGGGLGLGLVMPMCVFTFAFHFRVVFRKCVSTIAFLFKETSISM